MTATMVYQYMRNVTPELAEEFLTFKSKEVDMDCTITVEEVVMEHSRRERVMQGSERYKSINEGVDCKQKKAGLIKEENDQTESKSGLIDMKSPGFNLLDLLAKTVAKVNAMETVERVDENKKFKQEDRSYETMTASIVYHYMHKVTPNLAETFLTIIKSEEVDMKCSISVEEVVRVYRSKKVVREYERYNKDCSKVKCGLRPT